MPSVAAASETDPGLSEPTHNEILPKRQATGYRTGMEGPTGEERTAPTFSTRVLGARSGQSSPSRPENRAQRGAAPCGSPPTHGAAVRGRKAALAPPGPAARGPGTEGRAERTHHGGWRGPFKAAGGRFAAGPWLGHHLGEGGGNASGGGCSTVAPRSLSPAPPRACYINRRGTMSPNFVVGI